MCLHLAIFSIYFSFLLVTLYHYFAFTFSLFTHHHTFLSICCEFFCFCDLFSYSIGFLRASVRFFLPTFLSYILCCTVRFLPVFVCFFPFLVLSSCFVLKQSCSTPFFPSFSNLLATVLCVWIFYSLLGDLLSNHRVDTEVILSIFIPSRLSPAFSYSSALYWRVGNIYLAY